VFSHSTTALPVITTHPNSNGLITVAEGSDVMLRCEATGEGTLNYQWRRTLNSLPKMITLSDNNQILTIKRISTNDNGEYYCEVDNGGTSVLSNRVQLTAKGEFLPYKEVLYMRLVHIVKPKINKNPSRNYKKSIVSSDEVVKLVVMILLVVIGRGLMVVHYQITITCHHLMITQHYN